MKTGFHTNIINYKKVLINKNLNIKIKCHGNNDLTYTYLCSAPQKHDKCVEIPKTKINISLIYPYINYILQLI